MEAGAVPEKAMISHRGEKYEIGRGKRFYGIWVVGAPYEAPIDRWPESRDGWEQAWARFAVIETPGTIGAVSQGRTRPRFGLGRGGTALGGSPPPGGGPVPGNAAAFGGAAGGDMAVISDQAKTENTAIIRDDTASADDVIGAAPPYDGPPYGGAAPYRGAPYGAAVPSSPPSGGAFAAGALLAGRRGTALLVGEGLLVLGVVLGLAGLFPDYEGSQSLLAQGDQVVPHLCYVVAWAVSAGVIALGVAKPGMARLGALFALGLSAVTFGLFVADLGEVISGGVGLGTGLVVSLLGWLACTVGAALAMRAASHDDGAYDDTAAAAAAGPLAGLAGPRAQPHLRPRFGLVRPGRGHAGPLALLLLAGIGTAAAFAPSWDSYTLATASTGTTQTITAGNAFDNPGLVIAGNVAVMVAVIAVAALAVLWRPARQGALLLAGAIVPLAAQAVSALIQVSGPTAPATFGISSAEASAAGLTISSGVTAIFWVYCVFVIALLISCAWLFTAPGHPAMSAMTGTPDRPWPPIAGGDQARGTVVDESLSEGADSNGESVAEDADSDGGPEGGEHSAYA